MEATLDWVVQEGLSKEVPFKLRHECLEESSQAKLKEIAGRGNSQYKGLTVGTEICECWDRRKTSASGGRGKGRVVEMKLGRWAGVRAPGASQNDIQIDFIPSVIGVWFDAGKSML